MTNTCSVFFAILTRLVIKTRVKCSRKESNTRHIYKTESFTRSLNTRMIFLLWLEYHFNLTGDKTFMLGKQPLELQVQSNRLTIGTYSCTY